MDIGISIFLSICILVKEIKYIFAYPIQRIDLDGVANAESAYDDNYELKQMEFDHNSLISPKLMSRFISSTVNEMSSPNHLVSTYLFLI